MHPPPVLRHARHTRPSLLVAAALCPAHFLAGLCLAQPVVPNDECTGAITIECGGVVAADNTNATISPSDFGVCGEVNAASIWYRFVATATTARLRTCASLPPADDSIIDVLSGSCGQLASVACADDGCRTFLTTLTLTGLTPGEAYFVMLRAWTLADRGVYTLELDCPFPDPEADCNGNGLPDLQEIAADASLDCFNPDYSWQPPTTGGADALLDRCQCPADWNRSGVIDSSDISSFLSSWLIGATYDPARADFDCSGATNSSDISAFLSRWLGSVSGGDPLDGCP